MKKIIQLILIVSFLGSLLPMANASSRVQSSIEDARTARLDEINRLALKINAAEEELVNFRFELDKIQSDTSELDRDIFMRNTAGVVSALGFCATIIYHKKFVTPSAVMLVGGYTLSAISAIVMTIENKGIKLSQKEINQIKKSILKLEKIIAIEKKNLEKEILILSDLN